MVAAVQFSFQADGNRFLFLLLCVVALYVIARWASRRQEQGPADVPPEIPVSLAVGSHAFCSPDPQEVLASFPADPSLGRIRITKFFFEKLDAIPGPSDPAVFADDLNVELYDPDSEPQMVAVVPGGVTAGAGSDPARTFVEVPLCK